MNSLNGLLNIFGKNIGDKKEVVGTEAFSIQVRSPSFHELYIAIGQHGNIKEPHVHIFRTRNDLYNWMRGVPLSLIRNNYIIHDEKLTPLLSNDELYEKLISIDPKNEIHKNNRKRIVRALNYFLNNNKPISANNKTNKLLYDCIFIGLTTDRENLYNLINKRTDKMAEMGLIDEAKKIYDIGIKSKAVMTPIGYKEFFEYFDNKISLDEAISKIKQNCRRYAKRQYTWFKHQMDINWFDVNFNDFNQTVEEDYKFIKL